MKNVHELVGFGEYREKLLTPESGSDAREDAKNEVLLVDGDLVRREDAEGGVTQAGLEDRDRRRTRRAARPRSANAASETTSGSASTMSGSRGRSASAAEEPTRVPLVEHATRRCAGNYNTCKLVYDKERGVDYAPEAGGLLALELASPAPPFKGGVGG